MSKIEVNEIDKQNGSTLTLGGSGTAVTLASGATQSGFGRAGSVNWQTSIKTSGFTAVSGEGYFCNTTSAAFTVTLPASPSAGDIVSISDYANTFDTNNLTLGRNGSNIGGSALDSVIQSEGIALTLVYADATKGWIVTESGLQSEAPGPTFIAATGGTVTTSGDFKIHTFTGPGTFCVSTVGNAAGSNTVSYVVVAGGAGGGGSSNANISGGGGAGGYRESKAASDCYSASPLNNTFGPAYNLGVIVQAYPITVGSGGSGGPAGAGDSSRGSNGNNSVFSTITSTGGGGGGNGSGPAPTRNGKDGGSGGGAAGGGPTADGGSPGGSGNTPPVSPPQGQDGGLGGQFSPDQNSAGGGGAGAAGGDASPPGTSGSGGAGVTSCITASPVVRAGGGGGAAGPSKTAGGGGPGGGGAGGGPYPAGGSAGTANTGGGGGGSGCAAGAAGGSGIVIIRYKFQ